MPQNKGFFLPPNRGVPPSACSALKWGGSALKERVSEPKMGFFRPKIGACRLSGGALDHEIRFLPRKRDLRGSE